MDPELADLVTAIRSHPGLLGKAAIGLVRDVLGPTDWLAGPGDDAAVVAECGARTIVAGGEALYPPLVAADPFGAGVAAVLANVNDLAAMGARPRAILDTLIAPEPVARAVLAGIAHASALYDVPVAGGHLTVRDGPPAVSAFGVGEAAAVLSARNVEPGLDLLLACCLDGRMHPDFPFFSSVDERGNRLAGDVRLLAEAAEAGDVVAAKDVSMAGLVGSLGMLLEWRAAGATVDLAALPRPAGVDLARWLVCFPAYAFLLCVPAGRADACAARFVARGLACERIAVLDDSGLVRLRRGPDVATVLDLTAEPVTGLAGSPSAGA
ncbi:MAG: AIR synthase related protein [Actinomycetes bacterium]